MEKNYSNWIKTYVVDIFPCITVALYILAVIYNIALYSVFNINIISYISLFDMLLSIIDILILFGVLSIFAIWEGLFLTTYLIPHIERLEEEKKNKRDRSKVLNLPLRILRIIVHIKNSSVAKCISWFKNRMKSYNNKKERIHKERIDALEKRENYHSWNVFFYSVAIMTVSFFTYYYLLKNDIVNGSQFGATIALLAPLAVISQFPVCRWAVLKLHIPFFSYPNIIRKYSAIEILEAFFVYYIYAIAIFYNTGLENGKYLKNSDETKFEIKFADGSIINDSSYRYINNFNDKIFLIEKESNNNMVVLKNNITNMKIQFCDKSRNSIIVQSLDVIKQTKEELKNKK